MKKHLQLYIHISLWLVYSFLLVVLINKTFVFSDAVLKALVLVIVQAGLFYANSQVYFPKLIVTKKTWLYIINILILLFIISAFFIWFEKQFIPDLAEEISPNRLRGKQRQFRLPPRQMLNARVLFDLLSVLLILILSSAYSASQIGRKKELSETIKRKEGLESEMKFLKSQINPHFLFNSLNNIYSLTITGSQKSSEMILKLSAMLRYILYECNVNFVPIEKEWEYILNFIDFQKLKSKEEINLKLDYNNENPAALITPMIFIPFIENAFKHSNIENTDDGWVHISLNNKKDQIIFQIENSISSEKQNKDEHGGIGLENVKRRLELIYRDKYNLIINDNKHTFAITMSVNTKE